MGLTLTSDGVFLMAWGRYGHDEGEFDDPEDVAVDTSGNVYVTDTHNARIQKFEATGAYVAQWYPTLEKEKWASAPYGIALGADGNVFVAIRPTCRIHQYALTTRQPGKFGSSRLSVERAPELTA
jgi:DNA-binding beta-propeller fold protein YncE